MEWIEVKNDADIKNINEINNLLKGLEQLLGFRICCDN